MTRISKTYTLVALLFPLVASLNANSNICVESKDHEISTSLESQTNEESVLKTKNSTFAGPVRITGKITAYNSVFKGPVQADGLRLKKALS